MGMKGIAILSFAILLLALSCVSSAQETYYADVQMAVSAAGSVDVSGLSNHPGLSTGVHDEYTSKKGSYWLLNVTVPCTFSDYVYTLRLPSGSSVNYIRSSGRVSIGQEGESIVIEGTGKDTDFSLAVQYSISTPAPAAWWVFTLPVAVTLFIVIVWMLSKRKRKARKAGVKPVAADGAGLEKANYNPSLLTERQLAIVKALEKSGKPMTQRQIEQELSLPKSSVSRNISSLVRAGILSRHDRGMSTAVWFTEKSAKS
jgi:uncharacterized membrane protein